ncbi:MAG: hypothetical protein Ct9H300mP1_05850 [Planctomycetaceae bacterium]|nr:MAG: hypothetical protein Ct9H300mP1_05850 [Planctomycetaceae bacterium]
MLVKCSGTKDGGLSSGIRKGDSGVEDADGLGSRVEEFPFGERCGVGVEAHHLQKVPAVAIPDERVHCQGDFLGLAELAEAGHASGHVQRTTVAHAAWYSVS